MGWKIPLPNN